MGVIGVTMGLLGVISILTKSPWPSKYSPRLRRGSFPALLPPEFLAEFATAVFHDTSKYEIKITHRAGRVLRIQAVNSHKLPHTPHYNHHDPNP